MLRTQPNQPKPTFLRQSCCRNSRFARSDSRQSGPLGVASRSLSQRLSQANARALAVLRAAEPLMRRLFWRLVTFANLNLRIVRQYLAQIAHVDQRSAA